MNGRPKHCNRDVELLLKQAERGGWLFVRLAKGSHFVFRCGCGSHIVTVAGTSSDRRGLQNTKRDLKRCA